MWLVPQLRLAVVHDRDGQPRLSQRNLYGPLGMTSTSSRHADFVKARNHADLHVPVDGTWTPRYPRDPDPQSPAGGVSSNVVDLAKWMRLSHSGAFALGAGLYVRRTGSDFSWLTNGDRT